MSEAARKRAARPEREVGRTESRPQRTPITGTRDLLRVENKDPAFEYRWVADYSETGQRIWRFQEAGYDFVPSEEVRVGQRLVYKSDNVGSIVRVPAGKTGEFLYLMKTPREFYVEDQSVKQAHITAKETGIMEKVAAENAGDDGEYGETKITR